MAEAPAPPAVPFAAKRPTERIVHGERLVDDYAWLRDENWREVMRDPAKLAPEIRAYLEAENKHAEAYFADATELQKRLVAEMRGRIKEDDSTVPSRDGVFAYYVRYREGGQHPLLCRVPSAGGDEQLLLDGDALAKGHAYYNLGPSRHSRDHLRLAWSADAADSEYSPSACAARAATKPRQCGHDRRRSVDRMERLLLRETDADHRPSRLSAQARHARSRGSLVYEETDLVS
jgi:oligopeptidase B